MCSSIGQPPSPGRCAPGSCFRSFTASLLGGGCDEALLGGVGAALHTGALQSLGFTPCAGREPRARVAEELPLATGGAGDSGGALHDHLAAHLLRAESAGGEPSALDQGGAGVACGEPGGALQALLPRAFESFLRSVPMLTDVKLVRMATAPWGLLK